MAELFKRNIHCLLGIPFDAVDMPEAVRQLRNAATLREPCFLSTPNVNWVVSALTDAEFRSSVIRSNLSIVDGMPLVWVARFLGIPISERVPGSGLFETLRHDRSTRISVYFFGGKPGIAEAASKQLNSESGGLSCQGFECPGFGTIEEMSSKESIAAINASGADFVVVALGAKKGQEWIERNREHLSAPIISHLGAVVDFLAGHVSRAPGWAQRTGLEWLWRIKEDPALWKRYYSDGRVFLSLLLIRVVPYAWYMLWNKPSRSVRTSANFEIEDKGSGIVLHLRGVWVLENLSPLRDIFSAIGPIAKDLTLEMSGVTYIDSSFIGLLILMHDQQKQHGRRLKMTAITYPVRQILRYCCAEYLLSNDA